MCLLPFHQPGSPAANGGKQKLSWLYDYVFFRLLKWFYFVVLAQWCSGYHGHRVVWSVAFCNPVRSLYVISGYSGFHPQSKHDNLPLNGNVFGECLFALGWTAYMFRCVVHKLTWWTLGWTAAPLWLKDPVVLVHRKWLQIIQNPEIRLELQFEALKLDWLLLLSQLCVMYHAACILCLCEHVQKVCDLV